MLRDPRQKRFFKAKDMSDLFQLGDQYAQAPETAQIFAGVNSEIPLIEAGEASTLTTPTLPPPTDQAGLSSNGVSPDAQIGNNITPKIEEQGNHILRLSKVPCTLWSKQHNMLKFWIAKDLSLRMIISQLRQVMLQSGQSSILCGLSWAEINLI